MTAKIPVTKIEILYTEGTPKTPRTFQSWREWGAFLSQVVKPESRAALGRILDTYDLEGEMVNVAGLARRIPAAPDVIVRESILTMGIGDNLVAFAFRCPIGGGNTLACEGFAVRLSLALEEGAADPFARARALRGAVETVD